MPKKSQTIKGGNCSGAAEHGIAVYGAAGAQHAAPGGNVIAMNEIKGGKKNKGGDVLTEIAIPATLIFANQTLGKKRSMKYKPKSYKKNRSIKNRTRSNRKYKK